MTSIIDAKFKALADLGYPGAMSDKILAWLQANGASSDSVTSAWLEMLAIRGYVGQRNSAWNSLLGDIGYEGALPDRELAYWVTSAGALPPPI